MVGWMVFAVVFAVYAWTASPAIGWLDSPELIAASASLGVAHSPGHPLVALLGRAAGLVPIGDLAFRVNLASAACGAAAASALYAASRIALARVGAEAMGERARAAAAAGVALVFAFSVAAWSQGARAEVYALQMLLLAGALAALFAWDRDGAPRHLLLAGLLGGLALANHHFMAILFLAPAAVFVLARRERPSARAAALTACVGIVGLAAYLYLPVRSAAGPEVNWGAPHTVERFAWTVSARAFQGSATAERVSSHGEDAAQVAWAIGGAATAPLALLAILGLYLGLRFSGWRRGFALLLAIAGLCAAGRVLLGFDPETPDHHAYLLPAAAAVVLLGALALAALASALAGASLALGRRAGAAGAALLLLAAPVVLLVGAPRADLSGAHGSDEVARWELETLPPRALALVSYFQTSFRVSALRAVEGARPDVAVLDRSFLTYPGEPEEARRRHPELSALIDAPLRAGLPTPIGELGRLARARPVAVQLHPNLDPAPLPHLLPAGAFALFSPEEPTPEVRDAGERADAAARDRLAAKLAGAPAADREWSRLALLWHDSVRLEFYCGRGRLDAAARALAAAWHLVPGDGMLAELAEGCRLPIPP